MLSCASPKVAPFQGQTFMQEATTATEERRDSVRYIPAKIEAGSTEFLQESGGQTNFVVGRMRMTRYQTGRIGVSLRDRLPDNVRGVTRLPDHLGGGFVFHNDQLAYFASYFTSPLVPIARTSGLRIGTGSDAFYVFGPYGGFTARDPKTGAAIANPNLPPLPDIEQIFAISSRIVVATGPIVGPVKSLDGGQTWQRIEFDNTPLTISKQGDNIVLSVDPAAMGWFGPTPAKSYSFRPRVLQPDGSWSEVEKRRAEALTETPKINDAFRDAVLRGFPLGDGTAVYAQNGELVRVSLASGEVLERATRAFEDRAATCTPVGLATMRDPKAFGFVCGSRFGKTSIYRYEKGGLTLVRSFPEPRIVRSSGNGRLVVEGSCDSESHAARRPLCVVTPAGESQGFELSGAVDDARVVAMSDGKLALITPPTKRAMATLTLISGTSAKRVTLKLPSSSRSDQDVLQKGSWLEDFREHRAGVIAGWAFRSDPRGGDQMRGFEIDIDGTVREGQSIYGLGQTVISGDFGLGWPSGKLGWETVDGGMHWKQVPQLPLPLGNVKVLGCSAVGCASAGWLRLGWGEVASGSRDPGQPDSIYAPNRLPRTLSLRCEAVSKARTSVIRSNDRYYGAQNQILLSKFGPFASEAGPPIKAGERGFVVELGAAASTYEARTVSGSARIFAWGDSTHAPNWQAKWMSLGSSKLHETRIAAAPATNLEALRSSIVQPYGEAWVFTPGQTQGHALLVGRHGYESVVLHAIEGQPLAELRRPDGSAFLSILAALEYAGTVNLLEQSAINELRLWTIDGGGARVASTFGHRRNIGQHNLRLARHTIDSRVGMIVTTNQRKWMDEWLFSPTSQTEPAWPTSLGPREPMTTRFCGKGEAGWRAETTVDQNIVLEDASGRRQSTNSSVAFLASKAGDGCYESLASRVLTGELETFGRDPLPKGEPLTIPVALYSVSSRLDLRCRSTSQ